MKAIVLTCDKYMAFANHTILTYERHWPSNAFVYRVPYNVVYPELMKANYGDRIELIQTPSPIKATVLSLLSDLHDDEWIYWCMDDRYIVRARYRELQNIYDCVINIDDPQIDSVLAIATQPYFHNDKFIKKDSYLEIRSGFKLYETVFTESDKLIGAWRPQFTRVKKIRRLFESFPDSNFSAKEMNYFERKKIKGDKTFVPERNLIVVGESTHRGEITENCASSFKKLGLKIPTNFKVTKKYMLQGKLPYKIGNFELTLPPKIRLFLIGVERWYWRHQKSS